MTTKINNLQVDFLAHFWCCMQTFQKIYIARWGYYGTAFQIYLQETSA